MGLILRIQWIALVCFAGAAAFLHGRLIAAVPGNLYLVQAIVTRTFLAFWVGWLVWYSFGPGKRRPKPQRWLFLDPELTWLSHIPIVTTMWLTWPYADDTSLLMLAILNLTAMATNAFGSARLPPSGGFGSPLPLILPVSLILFLATHPHPFAVALALWTAIIGVAFLFGRHAIERLLNQVDAANRAAETALAEAVAARDAKAQFLASVSHDLGQPLQAARLFFDQTMRGADGPARERAARSVHWAFDSTEHLLGQMIDHLRLDSGQVTARIEPVAIGPLLARVAEMNEPAARLAAISLRVLPSGLVACADRSFAERAIGNLVGNAIRHAGATRVLVGARRAGERIRVWVIDDGRGVAAGDVARLFEDFAQGTDHGDEVRGGFGLGLASARRMAGLMAGDVGLDRRWTDGSAFWLELPIA